MKQRSRSFARPCNTWPTPLPSLSAPENYRPLDRSVWQSMNVLSRAAAGVPWWVWRVSSCIVAVIAMGFHWRRAVVANVRHVRGREGESKLNERIIGSQQIATHLLTLISAIRGNDHLDDGDIAIDGWDNIQPLIGRRGIVVVAPHCGSYPVLGMMMANRLRQLGFTGQIATMLRLFQPFGSHAVMDWFADRLAGEGLTVLSTDAKPSVIARQLISTLRGKGIVILFVDEPSQAASLPVSFFDAEIQMPIGPARLARAAGAMIVPCCATFEPRERHRLTVGRPFEPAESDQTTLDAIAASIEPFIRDHLAQWSMLTPIWGECTHPGTSLADLHLHTFASDGLLRINDWTSEMPAKSIEVIAITDHDHLATVARAKRRKRIDTAHVIPGVEITARGRAVHVGVLFPDQLPDRLIPPGQPISDVVRWARQVRGSVVILVHPLPVLWRYQLWRLRLDGLLPDAMEVAFPLAGWRSERLSEAAVALNIARLGGSDGHIFAGQLGSFATRFPGNSVDDLIEAIHRRTTEPISMSAERRPARPSATVYVQQCVYSWLFPFRALPVIRKVRQRLLELARGSLTGSVRTSVRSCNTPATGDDND